MLFTSLMVLVALLEYFWFGIQVGQARVRTGVQAPAMSGHPEFERYFRIHYNTLEQLVIMVPSAFIFAYFVGDIWAAALVAVFVVGRFVYSTSYVKDPAKRGLGFAHFKRSSNVSRPDIKMLVVVNLHINRPGARRHVHDT